MTSAMPWKVAINKELRALFPAWTAFAIASIVSIAFGGSWSWAIFILSAVVLGALSIGHEYLNGTLSSWLALPASRWQLMAAKLAAVVPLLVSLAVLATLGLIAANGVPKTNFLRLELSTIGLALAYGLIVAPWLTMVARGPLGGVVFTLAVPLLLLFLAWIVVPPFMSQYPPPTLKLFVAGTLAGAVLGSWKFMRLEALDTHSDVRLPEWLAARRRLDRASVPHPLLALFMKELRLQQLTFVVAGLSLAMLLVMRWLHRVTPDFPQFLYPLSVIQLGLGPILAGALASAEERRLGTLEWQVLQPLATWKQWSVKTLVAIAVSLLVSVAVLSALAAWDPTLDIVGSKSLALDRGATLVVAGITIATLYVSSVSANGLRAIVMSIPFLAVVWALGTLPLRLIWLPRAVYAMPTRVPPFMTAPRLTPHMAEFARAGIILLDVALIAGLLGFIIHFALTNHRSAERGPGRALKQVVQLTAYVLGGVFIAGGVTALYSANIFPYMTPEQRQGVRVIGERRVRWRQELERITKDFDGRVGVCARAGMAEACVNSGERFPMQSVMKLPVVIAVMDAADHGTLHLDEQIVVRKEDLSVYVQPIAKLVGPQGYTTTIDDLVRRAIVDSDNACVDLLIAKLGGPRAVQQALRRHELYLLSVDRDEKHLQTEINGLEWTPAYLDPAALDRAVAAVPAHKRDAAFKAYLVDRRDTSTPDEMTTMLERLAAGKLLSPTSTKRLLEILSQTTTFPDRLKAGVPDGWTIGHKTGTSGTWRGVTAAFNDVGILSGPKGETISIAVFISDSKASDKDMAKLMADIARAIIAKY